MPMHRALLAPILLSVVLLLACSERHRSQPQPSNDSASGTVEPVEVHFSLIQIAYERIMAFYAERPDSTALLNAAWQGAVAAVQAQGLQPTVAAPLFSGNARADLDALRTAFRELTQQAATKIDPVELSFLTAEAMARSLHDNHTFIMRPAQWRIYRSATSGGGANAGIVPLVTERGVLIAELVEGGPAARAGIRRGDQILAIDDEPVTGPREHQFALLGRLVGREGSTVRLTLNREGRGQFEVSLERAVVSSPLLEIRVLPGRIGYLRVRSFPPSIARLSDEGVFADALNAALARLQQEAVQGWIVDLRNNSGGDIRSAAQLTGRFVPVGPFVFTLSRYGPSVYWIEGPMLEPHLPVAVLVNEGSFSAAELVAAVMQEYKVAPIFGTKTGGIVDGAQTFELTDGGGVSVTTSRLLTGKERRVLDGTGVTPDYVVPLTGAHLAAEQDPQLDAALAYLRAQTAR